MAKRAYGIDDFCAAFDVGKTTVYEEINSRRLHAVKIGRRTVIPAESADQWLASLPPAVPPAIVA